MTENTCIGFDPGNGNTKIAIVVDDKVKTFKIPSVYSLTKPPGELTVKGNSRKLQAFDLTFNNSNGTEHYLWFGQDALGGNNIREIDNLRYTSSRISMLFKAALYGWSKKHKIDLDLLGKLNIVANIPPQEFANGYTSQLKAFRQAFNLGNVPSYIRDGKESTRIKTHFNKLVPEAYNYVLANNSITGWTLLVDLGYGTVDYVLVNGDGNLVAQESKAAGLLHMLRETSYRADEYELNILRNKSAKAIDLMPYCNDILLQVQTYTRKLKQYGGCSKLVLMGGTVNLLPKEIKGQLGTLAEKVVYLNEFANAKSNLQIALNEVK